MRLPTFYEQNLIPNWGNISHFSDDKYNFSFRKNSDFREIMDVMKEVVGGFDYKIEKNICFIKLNK